MTKRASKKGAQDKKRINMIAAGFTIIETMLFLAIAGLIFAGLVAGTNGTIRQQRYKDAVQGFVDDLRDLYSLAENTQVLDYGQRPATCGGITWYEGRGRSACSVYGVYAIISPTHSGRENVEAYWVTGKDQAMLEKMPSDREYLGNGNGANVSIETYIDDVRKPLSVKSHSILWGADIEIPCAIRSDASGCNGLGVGRSNGENQVAIFVYRSPITGSINTLTHVFTNSNKMDNLWNEDSYKTGVQLGSSLTNGYFDHQDVSFCITGGAGMGYSGGIRMVTISGDGANSNAVRLIEADSSENKCND